ncbi:hypothetical protein CKO38_01640 [Rhodospirillum rubrum]|uniref:DUF29 domain-containing protein n=1 Tax=Rhodospirillum rubrum TaxID=1085 RepID=UPI00190810EC|nr:DUF29 domain-containing protein [Rhodospirillum rubrum]MBK1663418.1 hypothetical protein [Rhodospirillum rubrum]MBK1675399.1 hypothetical protein [Rhodospirillum rubrum]
MGMEHKTYEADLFVWCQQQADGLRALSRSRRDLPDDLDLEHIAEEIEDMGRSELREATSLVRQICVRVIMAMSAPEAPDRARWRSEVVSWHNLLLDTITPGMIDRIDIGVIWRRAVSEAKAALIEINVAPQAGVSFQAPLPADHFLDEDFDYDATVARLGPTA